MDVLTEKEKMVKGELFFSFIPELVAERARCGVACHTFNTSSGLSQIERLNLWNQIVQKPLIDSSTSEEALKNAAWVEPPFRCDYGYNIELGDDVFINFNCTILDSCKVKIGSRTLFGPSVSLFAASHPLSAAVRNGTAGPEYGAPITIGEDCWLCGNVIVLPGITIGNGSIIGAGSVVTKDVPPNCVVAGNPAKIIRRLEVEGSETLQSNGKPKDEPKDESKNEPKEKEGPTEVQKLLEKLEKLEVEMKGVKEELKKHL